MTMPRRSSWSEVGIARSAKVLFTSEIFQLTPATNCLYAYERANPGEKHASGGAIRRRRPILPA